MRKIIIFSLLFMSLTVSCIEPVTIKTLSSSDSQPSVSPVVFVPKKGKGAITGIFKFEGDNGKLSDYIFVEVFDSITNELIKYAKIKKEQEFIIDDINILDKNETEVNLFINSIHYYKDFKTKIMDSKLTDIGTITFTGKQIRYLYGETMGISFIAQDINGILLKGGSVTKLIGGRVSEPKEINENGEFFVEYSSAITYEEIETTDRIEIKYKNKIMSIYQKQLDIKGRKITFIPNARTIYGYIFDSNKSKTLQGLKVKVLDQDIAVRTDEYGRYELRGVPFDEVNLEIDDTLKINVPKVSDSEERLMADVFYSR
jgi:hypothetical protein